MKHLPFYLILCAVVCSVGCSPKDEPETLKALTGAEQQLTGTIDPKMVGLWTTKDSKQHLSLSLDGKARMQATIGTRIGPQKIDSRMEWKVNEGTLSFKDEKGVISKFDVKVSDTELELKSLRSSTKYIKEK